jgi:cupin-like protein
MPAQIEELPAVTPAEFAARIQGRSHPVVLRGQLESWPAVRLARQSPRALFESLRQLDDGQPVAAMYAAPEVRGRFFYTPDLLGVNFEQRRLPLDHAISQLLDLDGLAAPPTIYVGALPLQGRRARFAEENRLDLLGGLALPRIWLGNAATVQTHLDMSENLACVVCGTRRFTLFPPEQIANLYVGPLDFTLAGQPCSLVRLDEPDFVRYPKFRQALDTAVQADLGPGDALYIPYMWWHHVQMTDPLNVLVNYWWARATAWQGSPFDCLVHALSGLRALPANERAAWQAVFNHYVFNDEDPAAHIPAASRGILAPLNPQIAERTRQWLLKALSRN